MKRKISVTQEDIDRGVRSHAGWCPIARAIKRTLFGKPGAPLIPDADVKVGHYAVDIQDGRAYLPQEAVEFIQDFDVDRPVKPFEFDLVD
jgi:hypothetical protein